MLLLCVSLSFVCARLRVADPFILQFKAHIPTCVATAGLCFKSRIRAASGRVARHMQTTLSDKDFFERSMMMRLKSREFNARSRMHKRTRIKVKTSHMTRNPKANNSSSEPKAWLVEPSRSEGASVLGKHHAAPDACTHAQTSQRDAGTEAACICALSS